MLNGRNPLDIHDSDHVTGSRVSFRVVCMPPYSTLLSMIMTDLFWGIGFLKAITFVRVSSRDFFLCKVFMLRQYDRDINCFVLRETGHETIVTK